MTQNEQTSPQTPQRRGIRLGRRGKTVLALLLILIYALSPLGHYGIPKKSSIFGDRISPSGKYRVELYHPRYSPYAYFAYRFPFFFRVYDTERDRYVYTSDIDTLDHHRAIYTWPEEQKELVVSNGLPPVPEEELR